MTTASEAAFARASPSRGAYARFIKTAAVTTYVLLILVSAFVWRNPSLRAVLIVPFVIATSAAAGAVCFVATKVRARPGNLIWTWFGAAAMTATLSQLMGYMPPTSMSMMMIHMLSLLSYIVFFIGLIVAVHQNERGRPSELVLDVALVAASAAALIVRWAPDLISIAAQSTAWSVLLQVVTPAIALSSLLLGAVLFTTPQSTLSRDALLGIVFAIVALVISAIPQSWSLFGSMGMWLGIAYAAGGEIGAGETPLSTAAGERLRAFVAPTVAIVLATISIEAAFNPPLDPRTGFALGVLGALVAVRLTELLNATRLQVAERRELAQTRALVEVSRALAGKNDLDSTLQVVTQWAVRVLNARAAAVELLSPDAKTLVLRAAEGFPDEAIGMTFPVETSYTGWVVLNGEPRVTTNPQRDPFMTEESLRFLGNSPVAAMPLRYRERLLGVLSCVGTRPFDGEDLELLRAFANQTALALEDARLFDQVRALSVTDPLTGLANRRQLERELAREFAAAQRGRRLVAVMFDLDDFKQHNDKFGHMAGDEALKHFAEALHTTTRTMNLAARYGGDEFLALLADADAHGAEIFVTRVKDRFKRNMEAARWQTLQVSAGIAEYNPEMLAPDDIVVAADRALYNAKLEADVSR